MDIYVRPGDSLWRFSEVFKIPLQLIKDSNRNINSQFLRVGQRIRIPGFVTVNYQVKQGDSFWQIAQSRNLPLGAILLVNPGLNANQLHIGQTIRIPQRITWRLVNGKQNYTYTIMMNDIKSFSMLIHFYKALLLDILFYNMKFQSFSSGTELSVSIITAPFMRMNGLRLRLF